MRSFVKTAQAKMLLHNKFVVILGGSVQRSMYKDLVRLLQTDHFLTLSQLKSKGEHSFERDQLLEGGCLGLMSNGTDYREVRQYHTEHHLLRFYFITRVYSAYMQNVLDQLRQGLRLGLGPDLIIVSSCVWDMTRYGLNCLDNYKENLHRFFGQMKSVVCHDSLMVWMLAMPLAKQIKGGFLVPEVSHLGPSLCYDIIEANFYGGQLADAYGLDVLDLHFHFRQNLQRRMPDGVHWDAVAHRSISTLLLLHVAQAWGIILRVDSSTSVPQAPPPRAGFTAPVSKRKLCKAKVRCAAPPPLPPPPLMGPGSGHGPWCPPHRPPGVPFCAPRLHFPRPAFRAHPSPRALLLSPRRVMAPPDPPVRCPPPDWGAGWGRRGCSGLVGWRRPNKRMHPYYPAAPNSRMHPYYPAAPGPLKCGW